MNLEQDQGEGKRPTETTEVGQGSVNALWQTYQSAQSRQQRLTRPVAVVLSLVVVFLVGVALWIVAVL